jgi:hypothetical protein
MIFAAALAPCAASATAAEKSSAAFVPAAQEADGRMKEFLLHIAREVKPDPKHLEGRIKQADLNSGPIRKRGLNTLISRWDKGPQYALACLATGENVPEANEHLVRWCRNYPIDKDHPQPAGDIDPRHLLRIALLPESRARLSDQAREAIEAAVYAWIYRRSQIDPAASSWNNASRSVWFLSGSENHDANQKMANLLALQWLCRHGRRYHGGTLLADGKPAQAHYEAWAAYWKELVRQRAREGIFCEIAQPGSYGRATISCYLDLYDLAEDAVLRRLGGHMCTLHFAQMAGEFEPRTGTRGAIAITRANTAIDQQFGKHWTKNLTYAWGWHDQPEDRVLEGESVLFSSRWRPPAIVTAIARGTRLPPYLSSMRTFGLGGDKENEVNEVLFADGEAHNSYIRRTAWVTPEYILSAITTDPARSYIALNYQGRLAGVTFSSGVNDRISILGNDERDPKSKSLYAINAVVWKDCLIAGRDPSAKTVATRIYISRGTLWDSRAEGPGGWLFLRAGDGFCALRAAQGGYRVLDAPHKIGYYLDLADIDSPIVLQTGRAADFPGGFQEFQQAVAAKATLALSDNCLRFRSLAGDNYRFWVKQKRAPELNGKPFDLNPPETYHSPYLTMVHGSDTARIRYPGFEDLVLDFQQGDLP